MLSVSITVALHHQDIRKDPQRITKISPFINNYNCKDINFSAGTDEYKKFERNNKDITLNILSAPPNKEQINIIYKSSHNCKRGKQVALLMITDNEQEDEPDKWHYLAVKSISGLFRGITSNHDGDFYCLGCLHSFRTNNALRKHERLCDNHDYCNIVMPDEDKNILKYNHGEKSLKVASIIYADLECLLIKNLSSQNNPEQSYTETKAIHEACGYAVNLVKSYGPNRIIRSFHRGKYCMEKFSADLKSPAMEITNFEKKEVIPLTGNETDITKILSHMQKEIL